MNETGSIATVVNGMIYNYESLRSRLKDRGHVFRSTGDCEVVVHAYEEWGVDLVEHLRGQFAFAIWDDEAGRLLLGRDRMGIKPLFVYHDGERIVWASELKGLMQNPDLDTGLNPSALPSYLAFGYVPTPGTFYRNVRALRPASCMIVEEGVEPRIRTYWQADFEPRSVPWRQAKREVRRLFRQSVKRRLIADVPLGVLLSGGLDSTIITAVVSSLTDGRVQTFTASFAGSPQYDEAAFARLVSNRLGTVHHEVAIGPDCIEQLDTLVAAHDGPFGDSSALPTYAVTRLAKENVTVALSGEGSDELFCGYLRFRAMEMASRVPGWGAAVGRKIMSALPHDPHHRGARRRILRFFEAAGLPEEERWLHWVGFFVADLGRVMKLDAGALPNVAASIRKAMNGRSNVLARSPQTSVPTSSMISWSRRTEWGWRTAWSSAFPFWTPTWSSTLPVSHRISSAGEGHSSTSCVRRSLTWFHPLYATGGSRVLRCHFRTGFVAPGVRSCMNACSRPTPDCGNGWIEIT